MRVGALVVGRFAIATALAVPAVGHGAESSLPRVRAAAPMIERRLANGMTVVVQEDHRAPTVSLALRYDAGERADGPGQSGLAALTTYVMTQASRHVPRGDYERLLALAGASEMGDATTQDATTLALTLPANRFELPLWLWSDQMGFFTGGDDALFAARRTLLEQQHRSTLEGQPLGRLDTFAAEELFPQDHPYRQAVCSPPEAVHALDRREVQAFHDAWMTPDHAILVVIGDVDTKDALAQVDRYFGPIPRSAAGRARLVRPPLVTLGGETRVDVAGNVPTARVSIRWPTPRLYTIEDARLDVVARMLAGHRSAWLFWKLVDEKKVATGVWVRQRSHDLLSELVVDIEGAPGRTAAQLLDAYDAAMDELKSRTPDWTALGGAVFETLVNRAYAMDPTGTRALRAAEFQALVGTATYFVHDFERYGSVSPQAIRDAITQFMPRDRRVVLLVTPDRSAAPGGERRGRRFTPAGSTAAGEVAP